MGTKQQEPQVQEQVTVQASPNWVAGDGFIVHKDYTEKSKLSGLTFSNCNTNHFCNGCGNSASLITKKWDAGQVVWSKFLCHTCTDKECDKYVQQITPVSEDGSNSTTNESSK